MKIRDLMLLLFTAGSIYTLSTVRSHASGIGSGDAKSLNKVQRFTGAPTSAAKWVENPIDIQIGISGWVIAESNSTVNIILGNVTNTITGVGTNQSTNIVLFFASVQPNQPVTARLEGNQVQEFRLDFAKPARTDLSLDGRNRGKQPRSYQIYVDGEDKLWVSKSHTNGIGVMSYECILLAKTELSAGPGGDVEEIPEGVAPGDGAWPQIGPGLSLQAANGGIKWEVPVGRMRNGLSASNVRVAETGISSLTYTPWVLRYQPPVTNQHEINALYDANGLRQIRARQILLDVVTNNSASFELRFYTRVQIAEGTNSFETSGDGLYALQTNASPFVVWKLSNPDTNGATCRLELRETRGSNAWVSLISYDTNNATWRAESGEGGSKRIEERRVAFVNSPVSDRIETNVLMNASNQIVHLCVETYHLYGWGWELASTVVDPGGANLTTTYAHYTDVSAENGLGKLKHTIYPDGYWEKRVYAGGALSQLFYPWMSQASHPDNASCTNSRVVQYRYSSVTGKLASTFEYANATSLPASPLSLSPPEDPRVLIPRYQYPWSTAEDDFVGQLGSIWPDASNRQVYRPSAGEMLNGLPRAICPAPMIATSFAHHSGTLSATNFSVDSSTNGSSKDWRTIAIITPFSAHAAITGQSYGSMFGWETQIDGQDILPFAVLPGFSTNITSYFSNGCKVREDVSMYTSATNTILIQRKVFERDAVGRLLQVRQIDGESGRTFELESYVWDGPLKTVTIDASGRALTNVYDSLKRCVNSQSPSAGPSPGVTNTFALNAAGLPVSTITVAGAITTTVSNEYDLAKRIISKTDQFGTVTTSYSNSGRTVTVTAPSGAVTVTNLYLDRRVNNVSGDTMVAEHYEYHPILSETWQMNAHMDSAFTLVSVGASNSVRYIAALSNGRGRPSGTNHTGFGLTNGVRSFIGCWQLLDAEAISITAEPSTGVIDSVENWVTNGFITEVWRQGYSDPTTSWIVEPLQYQQHPKLIPRPIIYPTGNHGIVRFMRSAIVAGEDGIFLFTTNGIYLGGREPGQSILVMPSHVVTNLVRQRLAGFTSNLISELEIHDAFGATNLVSVYQDRTNQTVTEVTRSSASSNIAVKITIAGLTVSETTLSQPVAATYAYDDLGRPITVTNSSGIVQRMTYEPQLGLKLTQTDFSGATNTFEYYPTNHINAQQLKCQTDSRGKKTYFSYNSRNQLVQTWGDVPYPEERIYSDYGEKVELHTFRGGTNWQTSAWPTNSMGSFDITRWTYQEATGLLVEKVDAKSNKWTYIYDDLNRPSITVWARLDGSATLGKTNTYTDSCELAGIRYSDSHEITFGDHSKQGLPQTITDDSGQHTIAYDAIGRIVADAFDGITNSYTYNQYGRASLSVSVGTNTVTQTNAYDSATGRLLTVGANGISATYSYLTNADLVSGIVLSNSTGAVLTTAKTFEYSSRLKSITNTLAGGSNVSSHVYLYDAIHRRTNATLADGSYWRYGYDDRSQLTSAKRYWSGGGVVAGQQYEYSYDSIGNRTVTQSGGSQFGTSLRTATWTVNELNQTITNAAYGYVNIFGEADANATVTVNHESVYRNGDFFRKELLFSNSSGPVYPSITNLAVINNYGTNGEDIVDKVIGNVWVPKNPETLLYDEDGNLIQDSRWAYRWDAENRLKEMEELEGLPTGARKKLVFTYDFQGRRASKAVYAWDTSDPENPAYALTTLTRFIYDGWNLLAELDVPQGTNAPVLTKSFLWGLDLSGTPDQAGGIGGLLAVSQHSTNGLSPHLPCFDGNGNVMALVNAGSGQPSARYEYAPFGEPLRVTGDAALLNPFRFSTKYTDDETGLLYYGYRYYSPTLAKWLNRDPLAEEGGLNLYAFCLNNPINSFDALGQSPGSAADNEAAMTIGEGMEGGAGNATAMGIKQSLKNAVNSFNEFQDALFNIWDIAEQFGVPGADDILMKAMTKGNQAFADNLKSVGMKRGPDFQVHHMATNKGEHAWNGAFKELFESVGLKQSNSLNLIPMPGHAGNHPPAYHQALADRLNQGLSSGGRRGFVRALIDARKDILTGALSLAW